MKTRQALGLGGFSFISTNKGFSAGLVSDIETIAHENKSLGEMSQIRKIFSGRGCLLDFLPIEVIDYVLAVRQKTS